MQYSPFRRPDYGCLLPLVILLWLGLNRPAAQAQAPAWQAAVAAGGSSSGIIAATADAGGNVYVTGTFQGSITLGSNNLTSVGSADIFVAKWSTASSSFVWAQRAGGPGQDVGYSVAVSGSSVYLTGGFEGSSTFGGVMLTLADPSGRSGFVAKLTDAGSTGSFVWALPGGSQFYTSSQALAVNGSSLYVTGNFQGTTSFGLASLTSAGFADVFIAKLTDAGSSGSFVWALRAGGTGQEYGQCVAVSGGSVYLTGNFTGTAGFGTASLTSVGGGDIYVAKVTDAGTTASFTWTQRAGSTATTTDYPYGLAVSGSSVYVAGNVAGTADFGATNLTTNSTGPDVFVAKLTDAGAAGSFSWAVLGGGLGFESALGVAASGANVYVAGQFARVATFGTTVLTSAGATTDDVFVAKLTDAGSSGSFTWATRAGGVGSDLARGVVLSGTGVYVFGDIAPPASFGSFSFATPTTNSVGFLASVRDVVLAAGSPALLTDLACFPNPAHGTLTVRLPAGAGSPRATLTLLDGLGRPVCTRQVDLPTAGTATELSVAGLAPGLYHLRAQVGTRQATRALVVE